MFVYLCFLCVNAFGMESVTRTVAVSGVDYCHVFVWVFSSLWNINYSTFELCRYHITHPHCTTSSSSLSTRKTACSPKTISHIMFFFFDVCACVYIKLGLMFVFLCIRLQHCVEHYNERISRRIICHLLV